MRSYTGAMRTNRTTRHARPTRRPTLAAMFVAASAAAAVTILVTAAVVALACYLAGAFPAQGGSHSSQAETTSTAPLIDPTAGRGAGSATCKHAPRSPRCLREGGTAAVVRDRGAARRPEGTGDGQTVLLGGEGARPAEVPGRVPGRGGWVSEQGPSAA
nr:MAG TPA: hypothetical protein [Caudoviricetes sp.]